MKMLDRNNYDVYAVADNHTYLAGEKEYEYEYEDMQDDMYREDGYKRFEEVFVGTFTDVTAYEAIEELLEDDSAKLVDIDIIKEGNDYKAYHKNTGIIYMLKQV